MSRASLESQRRLLEAQLQETEAAIDRRRALANIRHSPGTFVTPPPNSMLRTRSRPRPTQTFRRPHAPGSENRPSHPGYQTMQEAVNRLNQASSNISAALGPLARSATSHNVVAQGQTREAALNEANSQRAKRRKLNDGLLAKNFGSNYGYRGQVVPGPLRMEIVFCDGGLHEYGKDKYRPENVLRNDLSVYCTRSSKCDLVLRHEGGAPFCLSKLVIKAPETGFTAPIQEGMVFVAMDLEGLILKASRYTIRETPSASPYSSRSSSPLSSDLQADRSPALGSPAHGESQLPRPPSRRRAEDGTDRVIPPPVSTFVHMENNSSRQSPSSRLRSQAPQSLAPGELLDRGFNSMSTRNLQSLQPVFNVSVDCDNHSDDEEEESSEATLADRQFRERIPSSHDSSDEIEDPDFAHYIYRSGVRRRQTSSGGTHRHGRRLLPRRIEIENPPAADDGNSGKGGSDVLVPHATIFIEERKSMVNVKFEPPM
ncbi:MAG: hypothetical protein LQ346_000218 [Caloplaca aetnensis]|nr:MAG: hypothetical protein LQ346_000218 [Caloplaca aetnensis]